jgi:hypothetical protein
MARHRLHGGQHSRIADATGRQLVLDHGVAASLLAVVGASGVVGAGTVAAQEGLAAHGNPSR